MSSWLWGRHAVEEALKARARSAKELLVEQGKKGPHIDAVVRLARGAGVRVRWATTGELDRLCEGGSHQGMALLAAQAPTLDLFDAVARLSPEARKSAILVALDQIQDPHNLGAIARTAACLGAVGLIIPERRSAPVTQAVIQASAGAIEKIPVHHIGNLAQTLARLKEAGFWVYGADMEGKPAWSVVINAPMVLVIGSEGYGMRPLVKEHCDEVVAIPQSERGVASLNASCAASILLYEALRQLRQGGPGAGKA